MQKTLREREQANEVIVRIFQLGIVMMFTVLYSLATKPGANTDFQPVPFVLGAYLIASIVGLIWSRNAELPDWAVYFSILIDFSLLFSLMISFHYQYEQPASFILKAPALLYVFIFIALRALRLEWKFVVAAGIVAALGWGLIISYVLNDPTVPPTITKSYVDYLTSNAILIGAEIDKIITILAVTGILAMVVNGSANLLVTAIEEETAANDFSRFFDKRIAQDIRHSESVLQAGQGDRRELAIINVDIRGFSKISAALEPSDVMQMLSAYQGRLIPILQSKGAIIDKFMGDGIMATIGMETKGQPFCRLAVEAIELILQDARLWAQEEPLLAHNGGLEVGIAVASGTVSFGAVGEQDRLEMTVIGAPVNTSAKLEKHNKVLGSQCIVQKSVWDTAIVEGYAGRLKPEFSTAEIEGIDEAQAIAILSLP